VDYLIALRIHTVVSLIFERLGPFLTDPRYPDNVDEFIVGRELILRYQLTNQWKLRIKEKYFIEDYQLRIAYGYVLINEVGDHIFSCDNMPHHPQVRTFPHHKHRYPKDRFKPTEFSGRFEDFLEEVLWEITRSQ
jgi:hypothetical protein